MKGRLSVPLYRFVEEKGISKISQDIQTIIDVRFASLRPLNTQDLLVSLTTNKLKSSSIPLSKSA
jgi:hypothetical protein